MTFIAIGDGSWVNENFERLARIIKDYDPYLELKWIPPGQRESEQDKKNPYCIVDTRSDYVVMLASDRDTPESILERLFLADNTQGNVLDRVEARNAAAEAFKLLEKMDEEEEKKEFAAFLIGTKKNYIDVTHPLTGEKIKFDDQLRRRS